MCVFSMQRAGAIHSRGEVLQRITSPPLRCTSALSLSLSLLSHYHFLSLSLISLIFLSLFSQNLALSESALLMWPDIQEKKLRAFVRASAIANIAKDLSFLSPSPPLPPSPSLPLSSSPSSTLSLPSQSPSSLPSLSPSPSLLLSPSDLVVTWEKIQTVLPPDVLSGTLPSLSSLSSLSSSFSSLSSSSLSSLSRVSSQKSDLEMEIEMNLARGDVTALIISLQLETAFHLSLLPSPSYPLTRTRRRKREDADTPLFRGVRVNIEERAASRLSELLQERERREREREREEKAEERERESGCDRESTCACVFGLSLPAIKRLLWVCNAVDHSLSPSSLPLRLSSLAGLADVLPFMFLLSKRMGEVCHFLHSVRSGRGGEGRGEGGREGKGALDETQMNPSVSSVPQVTFLGAHAHLHTLTHTTSHTLNPPHTHTHPHSHKFQLSQRFLQWGDTSSLPYLGAIKRLHSFLVSVTLQLDSDASHSLLSDFETSLGIPSIRRKCFDEISRDAPQSGKKRERKEEGGEGEEMEIEREREIAGRGRVGEEKGKEREERREGEFKRKRTSPLLPPLSSPSPSPSSSPSPACLSPSPFSVRLTHMISLPYQSDLFLPSLSQDQLAGTLSPLSLLSSSLFLSFTSLSSLSLPSPSRFSPSSLPLYHSPALSLSLSLSFE